MNEIRELQQRWMQAWMDKDREALEEILHPRFTLRSIATDTVVDRETWLHDALSGRTEGNEFGYDEMTVVQIGETAICDNRLTFTATIDGRDWSRTTFQTDVWLREDGRWRVVRRHSSQPVGRSGAMQA